MGPSKARFIARHACWYKQRRHLAHACDELSRRLASGELQGAVYRCPFSHPDEEPHYHLTTGDQRPPSPGQVAEAIAVLGDDAWRVDDHLVGRGDQP